MVLLLAVSAYSQKLDTIPPKSLRELVSPEEYAFLVNEAVDYLSQKGVVTKVKKGLISFSGQGAASYAFAMDELVKNCLKAPHHDAWPNAVALHFDRIFVNLAEQVDFTDFEQVEALLAVRVYPESFFKKNKQLRKNCVSKTDFDGTRSTLVYDFPDQFRLVQRNEMQAWGLSEDSLFSLANAHLKRIEIQIDERITPEGYHIYTFFSSDYSPGYMLDFDDNVSFGIGKYGSLVGIPNHGAAVAMPIDDATVLNAMSSLHQGLMSRYEFQPGQVSNRFFWYYEGRFTPFPFEIVDGLVVYELPNPLKALMH